LLYFTLDWTPSNFVRLQKLCWMCAWMFQHKVLISFLSWSLSFAAFSKSQFRANFQICSRITIHFPVFGTHGIRFFFVIYLMLLISDMTENYSSSYLEWAFDNTKGRNIGTTDSSREVMGSQKDVVKSFPIIL
jgi:hypothetical protein